MARSFFIHLSSSVKPEENTPSAFTTHLAKKLEFNANWGVAITDMIYPHTWNTLLEESYLEIEWANGEHSKVNIPIHSADTAEDLAKHLSIILSKANVCRTKKRKKRSTITDSIESAREELQRMDNLYRNYEDLDQKEQALEERKAVMEKIFRIKEYKRLEKQEMGTYFDEEKKWDEQENTNMRVAHMLMEISIKALRKHNEKEQINMQIYEKESILAKITKAVAKLDANNPAHLINLSNFTKEQKQLDNEIGVLKTKVTQIDADIAEIHNKRLYPFGKAAQSEAAKLLQNVEREQCKGLTEAIFGVLEILEYLIENPVETSNFQSVLLDTMKNIKNIAPDPIIVSSVLEAEGKIENAPSEARELLKTALELSQCSVTEKMDLSQYISVKYDRSMQRFAFTLDNSNIESIIITDHLSYMLGFEKTLINTALTVAKYLPDLKGSIHTLYIYAPGLVENTIVGDKTSPLLRIAKVRGKHGDLIAENFVNPQYYRLTGKTINSIRIEIRSNTGRLLKFNYGEVTLALNFKKLLSL